MTIFTCKIPLIFPLHSLSVKEVLHCLAAFYLPNTLGNVEFSFRMFFVRSSFDFCVFNLLLYTSFSYLDYLRCFFLQESSQHSKCRGKLVSTFFVTFRIPQFSVIWYLWKQSSRVLYWSIVCLAAPSVLWPTKQTYHVIWTCISSITNIIIVTEKRVSQWPRFPRL